VTTFLQSMTLPFLACLVLTGIHVYLGIHVITRKVIFVDLSLATIAALGAVWGALLGWDVHDDVWVIKGFSLLFTFAGAVVFSLTRMRH
jgi:zinc/manganese transport system permease protein